ncbi:hypothetical protein [Streptomyces fuscigenes]|uniref:hypothetical protein n=1 Tax=Streptomyces fuscigenes TaxID=1528880 RepID=UPI001F3CA036|nr:hypothetical protein [Streptomyces fuscigenes]MCF3960925.1 hypothetical protein [Streptomyces fuscigenes]
MQYLTGGSCFRCDRDGVTVTHFGDLIGEDGAETPLFACRACVARLIAMHERAHEYPVRRYALARAP